MTLLQRTRRSLASTPANSVLIIATLALGMASTTLVFSVVDALLLRPLPFAADRLDFWWSTPRNNPAQFDLTAPARLEDLRRLTTSFDQIGGSYTENFNLTALPNGNLQSPERIEAIRITPGFLESFQLNPALGRLPSTAEHAHGGPKALVVSHDFFTTRLNADPSVLNKTIRLNQDTYTLAGVLPADFRFPRATVAVFAPAQLHPNILQARPARFLSLIALRKPGVSIQAAQTDVERATLALGQQFGKVESDYAMRAESPREFFIGDATRRSLYFLLAAVGVLLAISCANSASLMLARAIRRQRDFALQAALGASPQRITIETLTEGVVLSLIAAAVGTVLTLWGLDAVKYFWKTLPTFQPLSLDWRIAVFTAILGSLTGILASLYPAYFAARRDAVQSLNTTNAPAPTRWRATLLASQIALGFVLLTTAYTLGRSFLDLRNAPTGFRTSGLLTFSITLPWETDFALQRTYFRDLQRNFAESAAVAQVAYADQLPYNSLSSSGYRAQGASNSTSLQRQLVSAQYFDVLQIPILQGRAISERDTPQSPRVAVINQAAAALLFPNRNPVGQYVISRFNNQDTPLEVVGLAANTRSNARGLSLPTIYEGFQVSNWPSPTFFVQPKSNTALALADLRARLKRVNSTQAIHSVATMDTYLDTQVSEPRFRFFLIALFASAALLLSILGVYGLVNWSVVQRTQEIGIRMALGARVTQVIRLIFGVSLRPVLIGLLVGAALTTALQKMLVTTWQSHATASALLLSASLIATALPALRAIRIEPRDAIRIQ
jgi:predicted permease